MPARMPLPHEGAIRFWANVDRSGTAAAANPRPDLGPCWPWQGATLKGYGQLTMGNHRWLAHRLAWILTNGAIPAELGVLHRCDNPPCCNPAHLFLGTQADNMADAARKGRACKLPEYGEDNPRAKLTWGAVRTIRRRYEAGETMRAIASDYGMSRANIGYVVRGVTWREGEEHV